MQRPVIGIDLQWADGVSYSYCGLSEPDVWTEVQTLFDTYEDEEGDLIGEAKLDTCTIYMLTAGTRLSLFYDGETSGQAAAPAETGTLTDDDLVLKPTAAQSVTYVTYTQPDGDFTMQIPAGWEVTTTGDYISYVLVAYDPANAARGLLIQLAGVGFQSADAVALMEQSYGVHFPVMPEATTGGYFESWHTEVGGTFTVLENLGKLGNAEVLHARAVIDGVELEGLYTASVASLEYNMGINLSMTLGTGIQMLTAPVGETADVSCLCLQHLRRFTAIQRGLHAGASEPMAADHGHEPAVEPRLAGDVRRPDGRMAAALGQHGHSNAGAERRDLGL